MRSATLRHTFRITSRFLHSRHALDEYSLYDHFCPRNVRLTTVASCVTALVPLHTGQLGVRRIRHRDDQHTKIDEKLFTVSELGIGRGGQGWGEVRAVGGRKGGGGGTKLRWVCDHYLLSLLACRDAKH